ncbi:polysaccharide biosynthesis tyrosine autokinase [Segetibacter sp. 3557_3]|uniref:GumC family protein n=1 Tax=Segetibacter sp. 3557_3 TaxID=2547429 RepID=UPI001058D3AC|nr:polysaccharide biosynthesis tyrosine autokinase [Segetibacter sp. 3557_3]TDH23285.1 polysaccharide biosynthesis tyrosine autokinase [Segetibacter sp. 3557_3]
MSLSSAPGSLKENVKSSPKELVLKYLIFLPLFILSVALAVSVAFIYLRYTIPMYSSSVLLLIKNDTKASSADALADDLGLTSRKANLSNEMEILRSATLMGRVIDSLDLNIQYFSSGQVKRSELYGNCPFKYVNLTPGNAEEYFDYTVKFNNERAFQIPEVSDQWFKSGQLIKHRTSYFQIDVVDPMAININYTYYIQSRKVYETALDYSYGLGIKQLSRDASILRLTMQTEVPKKGRDILDKLVYEYNKATIEDKNRIVDNTLQFVDSRLVLLNGELGKVEQGLQDFRQKNEVIDIGMQGTTKYGEIVATEGKLNEEEVKVKMLNIVKDYVQNSSSKTLPVLSSLGIEDPTLNSLVQQYNQLQLEREQNAKLIPEANPIMQTMSSQVERLRLSILENIKSLEASSGALRNKTLSQYNSLKGNVRRIPAEERELLEITRQQGIKQELFLFLLQKREESAITRASAVASSYALDPAISSYIPVSPNKTSIYRIALIIGLLIPVLVIYVLELLKDKIITRQDVTKLTNVPILGEIAHHPDKNRQWVVGVHDRSILSEQFRIIRTNLQFFIGNKPNGVLLITSSIAGEGKTFTSMNIGAVWAVANKKTVILELDLRKPKISAALQLENYKGISNYMLGQVTVEQLPIPVKGIDNLYIIPAGPIPPNPSELLMDSKIDDMFAYLKKNFDLIVIDSAPIGLVSDTKILSRFADATLYIVRQRYTLKKQMGFIEDLYKGQVLPSMGLLVNDVKMTGLSSYYGYGYGYGYGYNYSSEPEVKLPWWKRLFNIYR